MKPDDKEPGKVFDLLFTAKILCPLEIPYPRALPPPPLSSMYRSFFFSLIGFFSFVASIFHRKTLSRLEVLFVLPSAPHTS